MYKTIIILDDDNINCRIIKMIFKKHIDDELYTIIIINKLDEFIEYINLKKLSTIFIIKDTFLNNEFNLIEFIRESNAIKPIILLHHKNYNIKDNEVCNDYFQYPIEDKFKFYQRCRSQIKIYKNVRENQINNKLINNMLPENISQRIKNAKKNDKIAYEHKSVTILFSDIVGFTKLSSNIHVSKVFEFINLMFSTFDELTDLIQVYKVETIGDAYMVACGHEENQEDHCKRVVEFGKKMLEKVELFPLLEGNKVKIRIGIHTGPAYSGVTSIKNPRYCFIGDTVNTASRMESNGLPSKINVSKAVKDIINDDTFNFIPRGELNIKGKGKMEMFILGDSKNEDIQTLSKPPVYNVKDQLLKIYENCPDENTKQKLKNVMNSLDSSDIINHIDK